MKKTIIIIAVALIMLIAGIAGIGVQRALSKLKTTDQIQVTEFSLPDVTGKSHAMSEWQGKVRVINFWATWCPPCRDELPILMDLQKNYATQNVQFMGIAIDDTDLVTGFLTKMNMNYPMLIAGQAGIELAYNLGNFTSTIPYTIMVNKDNTIVHQYSGEITKAQLQADLDKLLAQ